MSYGAHRNTFTPEAIDIIAKKPIKEVVKEKKKWLNSTKSLQRVMIQNQ